MPLTVRLKESKPGFFTLTPVGSIDTGTYMILEKQVDVVLSVSPRVMIFNMEGVNFMSSMGVRVVIKAQKALEKLNCKFIMVNLQPQIKKVFDLIYALPPQAIFNSVEEMDKYLAEMQRVEMKERRTL